MFLEHDPDPPRWWQALRVPYTHDVYIDTWLLGVALLLVGVTAGLAMARVRRHGTDGVVRLAKLCTLTGAVMFVVSFGLMALLPASEPQSVGDFFGAILRSLIMVMVFGAMLLTALLPLLVGLGLWLGLLLARRNVEDKR